MATCSPRGLSAAWEEKLLVHMCSTGGAGGRRSSVAPPPLPADSRGPSSSLRAQKRRQSILKVAAVYDKPAVRAAIKDSASERPGSATAKGTRFELPEISQPSVSSGATPRSERAKSVHRPGQGKFLGTKKSIAGGSVALSKLLESSKTLADQIEDEVEDDDNHSVASRTPSVFPRLRMPRKSLGGMLDTAITRRTSMAGRRMSVGSMRTMLMQPSQKRRLMDVFRMLDENGDGSITMKEFVHKMSETFPYVQKEELVQLCKQIDRDGSGSLSVAELKKALQPGAGHSGWVDEGNLPKLEVSKPNPLPSKLRPHGDKTMELFEAYDKERALADAAETLTAPAPLTGAAKHEARTAHLEKRSFEECLKLYFPKHTLRHGDLRLLVDWAEAWGHYKRGKAEWLAAMKPEERVVALKALKEKEAAAV
jgi:hypothetical protein